MCHDFVDLWIVGNGQSSSTSNISTVEENFHVAGSILITGVVSPV